jgi:uncharacterized protein YqhQ
VMILSRLIGIPILAAVGYEVLKIGAKFRHNPVMRVVMFPGILVQMITTKRPTDDMIEVAICSMEEALASDGNPIPAGSTVFERDPLVLPREEETAPASEPVAAATTDEPPAVT